MRIIFITPHLSTGGMPEYLRKKIELLKTENDVWVLELHTEWAYRIIRDKIQSLLGDRLIAINSNFEKMWSIIQDIKPDIIHFEELSDYHVPYEILDRIYTPNRKWKIFETFHDSSIDSWEKSYLPDKLIVVSPWQQKMMMELGIPIEVVNHEIDTGNRDREKLKELGLDLNQKHVMQVGLFSRRKNQSETFELAKRMPEVQFHFLGGLADNYKYYWEPLLANKPQNCHIWNERNDVGRFYQCFDAVIFPSRGNYGDRETNPLVIREAIAWKIPLLVRDLPVYMGMYRETNLVSFMSDDINQNVEGISKLLNLESNILQNKSVPDFNIQFNPIENKITFDYLKNEEFKCQVLVKNLTTSELIYSFDATFCDRNSYWCVPKNIDDHNFYQDQLFEGFLIEFVQPGSETILKKIKILRDIKSAFVISTYPKTKSVIDATIKCIQSIKKFGYDVIVTSHIPIPKEISEIANWALSDNNNILTTHSYYNRFWTTFQNTGKTFRAEINLHAEGNNHYHGPSCYTNYWNGCALAKNLGYNVVYLMNYDYLLENSHFIEQINQSISTNGAYFLKSRDEEGDRILTWFMACNPEVFLTLPKIDNEDQYNSLRQKFGSVSNGLENLLYHAFKSNLSYLVEYNSGFDSNFNHLDFSRSEYLTILPFSDREFVPIFISNNSFDSRILEYTLFKNDEQIKTESVQIGRKFEFMDIIRFESGSFWKVSFTIKDNNSIETISSKEIIINDDYFNNLQNNGILKLI